MPRAIAPQMASKDRNEEYARLKAEFDTMQAEMDALGIGASSKKLEEFRLCYGSSGGSAKKAPNKQGATLPVKWRSLAGLLPGGGLKAGPPLDPPGHQSSPLFIRPGRCPV